MQRVIKFEGKELVFNLPTEADGSVFDEIFRDREYREVENVLRNANVVLDFGAHKGLFSVYASALGAKQIYAFEPDVENFSALKEHLKMNGVRNVVAKNVAVAGESGERDFYLSEDSHNHSLQGEGESVRVRATSLVDILRKFRIERVDLLKVDIEGAEFELFQSMVDEDFAKIRTIFVEYHQFESSMNANDLVSCLENKGYRVKKAVSAYDKRMGYLVATLS